jgi:potassium efflux system protein
MKFIFLTLLFLHSLCSANIDTKLYDENASSYYNEVEKLIESSKKNRTKEIYADEKLQLSKVKEASKQKISILEYDFSKYTSKNLELNLYYNALSSSALVTQKIEKSSHLVEDLRSKILVLKKMIENIVEEEKEHLLSYQLQFAYYKLQLKNLESKIELFKEQQNRFEAILTNSLTTLNCSMQNSIEKKLTDLEKKISQKRQQVITQELQKEKALIEESQAIATIDNKIYIVNNELQELLYKQIEYKTKEAICILKEQKTSDFYKQSSKIAELIQALSNTPNKELLSLTLANLKDTSKKHLGRTQLLFGATFEESKDAVIEVRDFLFAPLFVFNEKAISIASLFMALIYIMFGFFLGSLYKRWILRLTSKWRDISMMSARLISNFGYYIIVLIFFIISIGSLGIDMSSLSLIAGALSIGIGFGLQTVVSNLIAGIILMFERTIRIGDIIEIDGSLSGTVTDMRIRSTTVKTFDNVDVVVPNSSFVQNSVINLTLEDRKRRLHIPFGVAYDTEIEFVKKVILETLESSALSYIRDDEDKKPDVRMTLMNSSSVDLELVVWIDRDPKIKNVPLPSDFMLLIYNALRANNIVIPFPQLDVTMKNEAL